MSKNEAKREGGLSTRLSRRRFLLGAAASGVVAAAAIEVSSGGVSAALKALFKKEPAAKVSNPDILVAPPSTLMPQRGAQSADAAPSLPHTARADEKPESPQATSTPAARREADNPEAVTAHTERKPVVHQVDVMKKAQIEAIVSQAREDFKRKREAEPRANWVQDVEATPEEEAELIEFAAGFLKVDPLKKPDLVLSRTHYASYLVKKTASGEDRVPQPGVYGYIEDIKYNYVTKLTFDFWNLNPHGASRIDLDIFKDRGDVQMMRIMIDIPDLNPFRRTSVKKIEAVEKYRSGPGTVIDKDRLVEFGTEYINFPKDTVWEPVSGEKSKEDQNIYYSRKGYSKSAGTEFTVTDWGYIGLKFKAG